MSSIVIDGLRWKILTINDRCAFEFGNETTIFWHKHRQCFVVIDELCQEVYSARTSDVALQETTRAIYLRIASQMKVAQA